MKRSRPGVLRFDPAHLHVGPLRFTYAATPANNPPPQSSKNRIQPPPPSAVEFRADAALSGDNERVVKRVDQRKTSSSTNRFASAAASHKCCRATSPHGVGITMSCDPSTLILATSGRTTTAGRFSMSPDFHTVCRGSYKGTNSDTLYLPQIHEQL